MGPQMLENQVKKSQSRVASPHPLRGGGGGVGWVRALQSRSEEIRTL